MTACPHCTKEIADATLDADWVKRSAIKGRLDEAGQNAAKPHLERVAALTVELQAAKAAAAELPTVRAQLDTLLDGDAFRRAGLGESASPDVLRMLHTKAVAALPEADRPDFRSWLTSETGAKADPSTAPLLAAWAAPAAVTTQTTAAASGTAQAASAAAPKVAGAPPVVAQPAPVVRPVPNAAAAVVEPAAQQRPTTKALNDEASAILARWKADRVTDQKAADAVYERETVAWQAKSDSLKSQPA